MDYTNNDRADAATKALDAYTAHNYRGYANEDVDTRVGDLICDLLHLVRRDVKEASTIDEPQELLERARANFEEEEKEEEEDGHDVPDGGRTRIGNTPSHPSEADDDDDDTFLCECGREERDCATFYGARNHRDRS